MSVLPTASEGLRKAEDRILRVAERLSRLPLSADESAPVDVVEWSAEVAALLTAKTEHAANAETARSSAELDRAVLDILG